MGTNYLITRTLIINLLMDTNDYKSYLEIGVQRPEKNFDLIQCKNKIGVDPNPLREDIINSTSDEYFGQLSSYEKFDLIFIDGLHYSEQVLKDIHNALSHLNDGGTIVCHDMLPENEKMQIVPMAADQFYAWTGDCWKAWALLRMTNKNLSMRVLNHDYGIGIIQRGYQELFQTKIDFKKMDFTFFRNNRTHLMNIIEISDFLEPVKQIY